MPTLDERMHAHPFEVPHEGQRVLIDGPEDADQCVTELVRELGLAIPFRVSPLPIETSVHEDENGPRVLFVMNPDRRSHIARVELPFGSAFEDLLSGESFDGVRELRVPMRGQSCRFLSIGPRLATVEQLSEAKARSKKPPPEDEPA